MTYEELEHLHDDCDFMLEKCDSLLMMLDEVRKELVDVKNAWIKKTDDVSEMKVRYLERHPKVQRSKEVENFLDRVDKIFVYRKEY